MIFSKRYAHTKVKFPCEGCEERTAGCHSVCEKYIKARKEADERLKEIRAGREDTYNHYLAEKKGKRNNR